MDAELEAIIKRFTDGQPSTCTDCYALVLGGDMDRHKAWHEKLRRAVDETESLS